MEVFRTKRELIFYFLRGAKRYFLLSACFAVLVSLLDMISPKIISFTVDSVIGSKSPSLSHPGSALLALAGGIERLRKAPVLLAVLAAVVGTAAALCRYLFRAMNVRGAEVFTRRTRDELFRHILSLPYAWMGENSTGDIIQRCTSDVQTIKRFISEQLTALLRTFILIGMSLFFMAGINLTVTIAAGAYIPVVVLTSLLFHFRISSAFEQADVEEGKLSAIAQENLTGVRVVRAFGREIFEQERFEKQNDRYTGFWVHLIRLLSIFWAAGDLLVEAQFLTVLLLGSRLCVRGSMSAGDMIAMVSYTGMLVWPVRTLGRVISEMSKAGISIDRLRYIMNAKPEEDLANPGLRTPASGKPEERIGGEIVFDHVTFTYPQGSVPALEDVSFTIPEGSTFGILGGTGSGKSTLMLLLERLYELPPENGRITIGGRDIRGLPLDTLRKTLGIVLQEPFLFSRTLEENIGITAGETEGTRPERSDPDSVRSRKIKEAAKAACIHDSIEGFVQGYDTFVGERGVTLSGGQKQRTAIAQLLMRGAPVMIFDDSLSAVDARTDAKIRASLREYGEGATVILIAHRLTTLMHADHIIVLEKGRIIEQGSHRELMEQGGMYRRIYDLQTAGGEELS